MVDMFGRILCIQCTGKMRTIKVTPHEAEFQCVNDECKHIASFRLERVPLLRTA